MIHLRLNYEIVAKKLNTTMVKSSILVQLVCILACITQSQFVSAQNYLINADFEGFSTMPTTQGQADYALDWEQVVLSGDYVNTGGYTGWSPQTGLSYSGNGYMGFASYGDANGSCEAVGQNISANPLIPGVTYTYDTHAKRSPSGSYSSICSGVHVYGFAAPPAGIPQVAAHVSNFAGVQLLASTTTITNDVWEPRSVTFTVPITINYVVVCLDLVPGCKQYVYVDSMAIYVTSNSPVLDLGPDTTLCTGTNYLLDATTPGCTYLWQDGSTNSTFNVTTAGTYWATIDDGQGGTATDTVVVDYINPPTVDLGPDTTVCAPQTVLLDAEYTGATYLWQDGSTDSTFTASAQGLYWVDVTNQCGTVSDSFNLTVIDAVQPFSLGADTTLCPGQDVLLDATTPNATSYLWQDASTNPTFLASAQGTYFVSASNVCGSEVDTIVISTINAVQAIDLGPDTTICQGQNVFLDGTALNATLYLWQDASTNPTLTASTSGLYWVEATNVCGTESDSINITVIPLVAPIDLGNDTTLCTGQSLLLDGTSANATTYLWQDASSNPTLSVSTAGTYWVEASNQCGMETDAIIINVVDAVTPFDLGNDTTICQGDIVTLDATTPFATSYLWQDGSTNPVYVVNQTGTYSVGASNQCGTEVGSIDVTVISLNVDLGVDATLCQGDVLPLDAGAGGTTYTWSDGSSNQTLNASNSGTYWVTVQAGSCTDTDSIDIQVQELYPSFFAPVLVGCAPNLSIGFINESTVNIGSITDYAWSFGNQEFSTAENPTTVYQGAGSYDVSLTIASDAGCVANLTYPGYITVNPQANAGFQFGPGAGVAIEEMNFINTSQNSTTWTWDFGDGGSSNQENPFYSYDSPGTYTITLFANNQYGCMDSTSRSLNVVTSMLLYVPNTFTPDGDEFNQVWRPVISEIDTYDYRVRIFNRWGEVVWETRDPEQGWDGSYAGRMVESGTYTWTLEVGNIDNDGRTTFNGHVNILR